MEGSRPRRRASSLPRKVMLHVFRRVVISAVSARRPRFKGIPLKRVTKMGRRPTTVGPSRTAKINRTGTRRRAYETSDFHPVSRMVVSGMILIPNTSTHPASTRKPIPRGAETHAKASIRNDKDRENDRGRKKDTSDISVRWIHSYNASRNKGGSS